MEHQIPNDLLEVVCRYTVTPTTMHVLTSFDPYRMYDQSLWKYKTLVEARGLVVNDSVVDEVPGGWYAYYLTLNKTYCGDLYSVKAKHSKRSGDSVSSSLIFRGIIFHDHITIGGVNVSIVQYSDYTIRIYNTHIRGMYRRIIAARDHGTRAPPMVLDEYGDLWTVNKERHELEPVLQHKHIIDCLILDSDSLTILTRQGCLLELVSIPDTIIPYPRTDITSLHFLLGCIPSIVDTNGELHLAAYLLKNHTQRLTEINRPDRHLYRNITTTLKDAGQPDSSEHNIISACLFRDAGITLDRTLYFDKIKYIDRKHHAQRITTYYGHIQGGSPLLVILDSE